MSVSAARPAPRWGSALEGMLAPLRQPVFQRIWLASLLSNFGLLVGGVGAAWAMTQLTSAANMVALVQTASLLPVMFISLTAGAIADMYDRRKVGLIALAISLAGAGALTGLAVLDLITPSILLAFCFIIGSGNALFGPAWQASVGEQVPPETLPSAIALNSISFNIARSFGPALGGIIVAAAGATAAFGANALLYVPLILVLFLWRRKQEPSRLPPERLNRAIVSGLRYLANSSIRIVLGRTFITGILGGSVSALMPLVAKDVLHGDARTFGVMLGAFGVGAVVGAMGIEAVRKRFSSEQAVIGSTALMGACVIIVGVSPWSLLTAPVLVLCGAAWMVVVTIFNIATQLSAPRWVAGRALAGFQTAVAGGVALGAWGWGQTAGALGTTAALVISGVGLLAAPLLGFWLRMPAAAGSQEAAEDLADPEVNLALTARSGPIVVHIDYRIDHANARAFHGLMQDVQLSRQRNGAYGWSISRDIAEPERWTERFHCPTWLDYLRMRNRPTQSERDLQERARAMQIDGQPMHVGSSRVDLQACKLEYSIVSPK